MKVVLQGEQRIRFEMAGQDFEIASENVAISPYHLLAASLASCTALTVASWAGGAGIGTGRLAIDVAWEMADRPKRVTRIEQTLHWPELPEDRVGTAERVAGLCPIHATLHAGAVVTKRVERG